MEVYLALVSLAVLCVAFLIFWLLTRSELEFYKQRARLMYNVMLTDSMDNHVPVRRCFTQPVATEAKEYTGVTSKTQVVQ